MRELVIKRQNGSTLLKATSWAIYDKSELKQLTDEVVVLINSLEMLFSGAADRAQLMEQEVKEIPNPQDLQLVAKCAEGVDSVLEYIAKEPLLAIGTRRLISKAKRILEMHLLRVGKGKWRGHHIRMIGWWWNRARKPFLEISLEKRFLG
ncbi:hypothetical protein F5884DRAFT_122236 [Xylogone sp. PMI_703]|nr:hypothetical protein F5884DRAFT_122236 [Xylogone sp. PMI_703]